ncbi:MAG TPA: IS200/IS605 family transposase [Chitinophagaceae bacterium]|nr:IS200/IS605 family transposase [Chitinophagaceae bacterium]
MPYLSVWLHLVWTTKNRFPFLKDEIRSLVFDHIRENAFRKEIFLDCVNGYVEHIHCLVSLGSQQTISKLLQLLKGESSHWINEQQLCPPKFDWQDEYYAVSVSYSQLARVRAYIQNQEKHHQRKTFQQEYEELMHHYGFGELKPVEKRKTN